MIGHAVLTTLARWFPQAWLAFGGLIALALVPVGSLWTALDARRIKGEPVARKPMRFALSIGVYLLTMSWMLGYVQPGELSSLPVRGAERALSSELGSVGCCMPLCHVERKPVASCR
ncbi:hypothetical protein AA103196_2619 [Ameyamaea chiangmaiensis NBRC 103196]|uniref:Uncharacterized protein n=1 Tax=Ameyamaea chiangmaiensis TaxID=442969 RepID=A0A850PCA1_9PROT|nr:hypothetical protein [Ameyamaea chiangmaiensis]MBS4075582.1 hypothetical protein [Ameyamaea chiangmaiensis]NVN40289.1 hypothetical protein [Ameyamaea chiangmaiensis]GBQ70877.1 hypothetical protein AA103196_2619 [Ameyamaea chiangmaiensis NBRC 103196]